MREADHDNILDFLDLIQLTESVATKIHGVFDQDEIFRILSDELKRSEKYRMITMLLSDDRQKISINSITIPADQVRVIETLIGEKVIGFTVNYEDLTCFHPVIEQGDTYPIQTMEFIDQLLPEKVTAQVGALTGHVGKTSIVSPIKTRNEVVGVFGIDMPEAIAYAEYFKLSVKNLTRHLSTALQLAEEHQVRQKTELELKNDKDRFDKIIKIVPGVIYTFKRKPDGSVSYPFATPSMHTLFGLNPEDLQEDASAFIQLVHKDDLEYVDEAIRASAQNMTEFRVEYRYEHPQKGWIWVEAHSLPIVEPDDCVVWTGFLTDITGRKLADEKQRVAEENLKSTFNISPSIIAKADIIRGYFTEVNAAVTRILGYTAAEFTSKPLAEFIHEDDRERTQEEVLEQLHGKQTISFENRYLCKDGSYKWMAWNTSQADEEGIVIATGTNVTGRKLAESKLNKLSAAMEQSPTAVIMTDLQGNINYVNPKFEEVSGYAADKVMGKNPRFLNSGHTTKEEYKDLWKTINAGKIWNGEFHNKKRDGTLFWERASIGPIFNDKGEITDFLAVKEDITKLKKAEGKLKKVLAFMENRVEERTAELRLAKEEIERTHNEFQDSLRYAKQIQEAIIPSDEEMSKMFRGVFSIYRPKDVISGDFYWCHDTGHEIVLVVADCTGHGVPGALMSMSGHELLDSIVINRQITRTDMILEEMDLGMKRLVGRQGGKFTMNDGMDMSVVRIDRSGQFDFSGAQSHGLYIKQNEVIPLIPDRVGIGGHGASTIKEFSKQRIVSQPGDRFYLFSDGFYDQFGGPNAKKMMRKRFTELLVASSKKTMKEQQAFLERQFKDWKGTEMQIDDVTVIGIAL